MSKTWVYGKDPNPRNYHEAADILKRLQKSSKKKKKSEVYNRLDEIKRMLKDTKP